MTPDIDNLLPHAARLLADGSRIAIATLVYTTGSAPRPVGSQMVITEQGDYWGYLTGGCAEAAVAALGVEALQLRRNRVVRLGFESPYVDIQLPCGAGIDIFFHVDPERTVIDSVLDVLKDRRSAALETRISENATSSVVDSVGAPLVADNAFRRWFAPVRRFLVIGAGPIAVELAILAQQQRFEVGLYSPDVATLQLAAAQGVAGERLTGLEELKSWRLDQHGAACMVFHEHERELALFPHLLASPLFFIGALGSQRTHARRLEGLRHAGIDEVQIGRISGPVGLDIRARTPQEIALSIMAEVTQTYRKQAPSDVDWTGGPLPDALRW